MQFQSRRAIVLRVTTTVALFYCYVKSCWSVWIDLDISEAVLVTPAFFVVCHTHVWYNNPLFSISDTEVG